MQKMKTIKSSVLFLRRAKKLLKRNPHLKVAYEETVGKLANDPFDLTLHTHPLKGSLYGLYACSLTYKLRIIFELTDDCVALIDIGSHDEVY